MVKNIYRCENCMCCLYGFWACEKFEENGYCQNFKLNKDKISEVEHIKYKAEFQRKLAMNRLIEMIKQTQTQCYCLPTSKSITLSMWLKGDRDD